tara:strand:+ start:103 stop:567 length:465 start_codon:yes stop_codon:yes gene_type:complete
MKVFVEVVLQSSVANCKGLLYLGHMNTQFSYIDRTPQIPEWSLSDRLTKARNGTGMTMRAFAAFTSLTIRQIQYAESGDGNVSDVVVTVYAFKSGIDYWWIKTGHAPDASPNGDGGEKLLGLDSNQEPIGSFLAYQVKRFHSLGDPFHFLERAA